MPQYGVFWCIDSANCFIQGPGEDFVLLFQLELNTWYPTSPLQQPHPAAEVFVLLLQLDLKGCWFFLLEFYVRISLLFI